MSICVPAYKAEAFIANTLASIAAQTFSDWELIVVEDGSRDGTEGLVRAFAVTVAQPVTFYRQEENRGLPATRNTAIARSVGEWIALIDADDLWTPDHLAGAVACARAGNADLVHTGVVLFESDSGRDIEPRVPSAEATATFPRSLFLGTYLIQPSSVLLRRSTLVAAGSFDPGCRYVEDRELWLRLVRGGARVAYVPAVTCRYRIHAGAMTRNAGAMAEGVAEVFERNADWEALPAALRSASAAEAWCAAGRIWLRSQPERAHAHFLRALKHRPWSPRLLAYAGAARGLALVRRVRR